MRANLIFLAPSNFDQSLISAQYLGQLCSSSLAFLILLRHYWSADNFFSSAIAFFFASVAARALAFIESLILPRILGAMSIWSCLDSGFFELFGLLCCCSMSSSPAILSSNKCQSHSRPSVFIGGDRLSCPIKPSMR